MIKIHGCGCRYRKKECEHLCSTHKDEFILKQYNAKEAYKEWIKIADAMNKQLMENNS